MELFPPLLSFSFPFRAFDSCLILDYALVINFIIIIIIIIIIIYSPFLLSFSLISFVFLTCPGVPLQDPTWESGCSVSFSSGSWGSPSTNGSGAFWVKNRIPLDNLVHLHALWFVSLLQYTGMVLLRKEVAAWFWSGQESARMAYHGGSASMCLKCGEN